MGWVGPWVKGVLLTFRFFLIEGLVCASVFIVVFCGSELPCWVVDLRVGATHRRPFLVIGGGPLPSTGRWGRRALGWQGLKVGLVGAPVCVPWFVRDASPFPSAAYAG